MKNVKNFDVRGILSVMLKVFLALVGLVIVAFFIVNTCQAKVLGEAWFWSFVGEGVLLLFLEIVFFSYEEADLGFLTVFMGVTIMCLTGGIFSCFVEHGWVGVLIFFGLSIPWGRMTVKVVKEDFC